MTAPLSPLGLRALEYTQEYGWPVFPVRPRGKEPLIEGGFLAASAHPEQVCAWWDQWPDANIGFVPGLAGLVVLDADSERGESALSETGALDVPTLEVITSKGRHIYYRIPKGVTIGNASPWKRDGRKDDVDVRGHAGYTLLPPSVHPSGHVYTWRGEIE